jgi:hypothetical protein
MRLKSVLATALVLLALPALAEGPAVPPTPIVVRGTIEKLDGQLLVVNARDGQIALLPNLTVAAVVKRTPADIKEGAYVAVTSVTAEDGRRHALEVHIFPHARPQ